MLLFQSTLPRREWRWYFQFRLTDQDFNPHSHEGSDMVEVHNDPAKAYFNPHSHEGSDLERYGNGAAQHYHFNPHSHEGSD